MNLVTGATGIVGSHVVIELLKRNQPVKALVRDLNKVEVLRRLAQFHQVPFEKINLVKGDINDPLSLLESFEGCDVVYHCAGFVSFNPGDARKVFQVNINGTQNVVDACLEKNVKTLAYISSTAAIGDQKIDGKQSESSTWTSYKGKSHYALSKHYAELEVWRGSQEGLQVTMVNPGVIIGPGNWGQSSTTLLKTAKKGLKFYPSGINGFVDARDVAETIIYLVEKQKFNERFLMVGEHLSFKDLFTTLAEPFGQKGPNIAIPKAPVLMLGKVLAWLESWGISPFSITSENFKSAYRKVVFDTTKATANGIQFRTIKEAAEYSAKAQFNS